METGIIEKSDKNYPALLKKIPDAPKKFYYKGEWPFDAAQGKNNIFANCLAVVGSRRLTSYGKRVAEQIVGEIAASGITIVSGFMYGGDAAAHKAALDAGGKTIAVMPCGIDMISPEYQKELYNEILENEGLIISEYEAKLKPLLWMYPKRNRIVAGLSKAILVLEAGLDSGTLITADFAKRFGRKIFAVPSQIFSEVALGSLKLIKEGAEVVTRAQDVIDYYRSDLDRSGSKLSLRFTPKGPYASAESLEPSLLIDSLEQKIIVQLKTEPMEVDDLARNLRVGVSELGTKLTMMQVKGIIKMEGNKYCC